MRNMKNYEKTLRQVNGDFMFQYGKFSVLNISVYHKLINSFDTVPTKILMGSASNSLWSKYVLLIHSWVPFIGILFRMCVLLVRLIHRGGFLYCVNQMLVFKIILDPLK